MNIRKILNKCLAFLAVALIICQFNVFFVRAQASDNDKTTVIAASDFQASSAESGVQNVELLLKSMKNNGGISSADGFLFCGDYSKAQEDASENTIGVASLKSAVSEFVPEENMVFAQGNHDCEIGTLGMSPSGNNDPANGKYGVFVINEDDYMWFNSSKPRIEETAATLEKYLGDKIEKKFQAPIFIVSHLPLHASMRTVYYGDGRFAKYILDVLSSAGEQGLNIVFLFGHNHGDGWDDYLGGSSVYLAKGDDIVISKGSMDSFETETVKLSFYYLNAGYVGYYAECNEGADCMLTMTSFSFDDNSMEIIRYDVHGVHNLKSKGVINAYKGEDTMNLYSANTNVYPSPQVVKLNHFDDVSDVSEVVSDDIQAVFSDSAKTEMESEDNKSGCGATVGFMSVALISAITVSVIVVKKRRK